jgi:malate synthase
MISMQERAGLQVAAELVAFIERDVLPPLKMDAGAFWRRLADIFAKLMPENRALLAERDRIQAEIDAWHRARRGKDFAWPEYRGFLEEWIRPSQRPSCTGPWAIA